MPAAAITVTVEPGIASVLVTIGVPGTGTAGGTP